MHPLSKAMGISGGSSGRRGEFRSHYRRLWIYSVSLTALVSLTPLGIMTWVSYTQCQQAMVAERDHLVSRIAANSQRIMDSFLEERRAALSYVVNRESYEDLCDRVKLGRVFLNMNQSFGGLVDLGVIDSDGQQRAYVGPYELQGKNYKDQDWFHEVRIRGIYVSDVFTGFRNVPHFVIAARRDIGNHGGFYVIRASIDTEVLSRHVASLELRAASDAFLINRKGILQTPSRHAGGILDPCPIAPPPFSANPQVLEVSTREGQPRILGYAYIQQSPFIFVVLKRPEDVMQGWLRLKSEILWLFAASVVLIVAVVLASSTFLVNRIREADRRREEALHNIEYTDKLASIGRMAAGVAHEINNPLAVIGENAGLLKDLVSIAQEPPDKARLLRIAEAVLRSVERCSTITHRLLGFAKRMEPRTEQIAIGPLLEEVLSFQRREAAYRRIAIDLALPENLPIIESDRGQLQQVFLNIFSNAFAAVEDGGRIDVSAKVEDQDTVAVTIRDNGCGIPPECMDRIFEPFFSTKGDYGTGLGLFITLGIVEKLGGRIEVQSKVGAGTSFNVRLPVRKRS